MTFALAIQLQQFRQKKDGKGSKSSSKSNKSEGDTPKAAAASEQVVDGEVQEHNPDVISSELDSRKESRKVGSDADTTEQSSKVGAVASSSTMNILKLPLEDSGTSDSTLDLGVENKHDDIAVLREGGDPGGVHDGVQHEVIISEENDVPLPAEILSQGERPILEAQVTDVGCAFSLTPDFWNSFSIFA